MTNHPPRRALITGITGQDGSYLAEFLLAKGYEVHGLIRRSSSFNTNRINHIYEDPHESEVRLRLHFGDLSDSAGLMRLVQEVKPLEDLAQGHPSEVGRADDVVLLLALHDASRVDVDGRGSAKLDVRSPWGGRRG